MVVGVLDELNDPINYNGVNLDESIIIDINYASTFESSIQIQQINVRTATTDAVQKAAETIKQKLIEILSPVVA